MNSFYDIKNFLKSWGLFPSEEDTEDYNPETVANGINSGCYNHMMSMVKRESSEEIVFFLSNHIDATDDCFYLNVHTWEQLKASFAEFQDKHPVLL